VYGGAHEILTPRLRLRGWRAEDEPAMRAINEDEEVSRYLNRPVDDRALDGFLAAVVEHWTAHGFGAYAVESRERPSGLLGFVGVAYPSFLPELADRPELGWRLARPVWGRDVATEAARAARADAFTRLGLERLISIIHPENERSRRVAVKLGMTFERQVFNPVVGQAVDVWQTVARPA
jgi:RimJ/RimL family protein N-acetyltransferase